MENTGSEPISEPEDDPITEPMPEILVIPRTVFYYAIIAVVCLGVGGILGVLLVRARAARLDTSRIDDLVQAALASAVPLPSSENAQQPLVKFLDPNQTYSVSADDDPAQGPPDAPVALIEFGDFRCLACATFANDVLPLLLRQYAGKLRFVFRDLPEFGDLSVQAGLAADCANDQGHFWDYHHLLFQNQAALTNADVYPQLANQLGLDMKTFSDCFSQNKHLDELRRDYQDSQRWGRIDAPTFFVNGKPIFDATSLATFQTAIDAALAATPEATAAP